VPTKNIRILIIFLLSSPDPSGDGYIKNLINPDEQINKKESKIKNSTSSIEMESRFTPFFLPIYGLNGVVQKPLFILAPSRRVTLLPPVLELCPLGILLVAMSTF
jgi:hypothetical protein